MEFGFRNKGSKNPQPEIAILQSDGPIAQSRLERTPDKREVVGSIPTRPTTSNSDFGNKKVKEEKNPRSAIANPLFLGGVAQLGEHLLCTQEVIGSIPFTSTIRQLRAES